MCDSNKEVWEESCGECKYHRVFFDCYGYDGCLCDNEEAEKHKQHIKGSCCTFWLDSNCELKRCPYWEEDEY